MQFPESKKSTNLYSMKSHNDSPLYQSSDTARDDPLGPIDRHDPARGAPSDPVAVPIGINRQARHRRLSVTLSRKSIAGFPEVDGPISDIHTGRVGEGISGEDRPAKTAN